MAMSPTQSKMLKWGIPAVGALVLLMLVLKKSSSSTAAAPAPTGSVGVSSGGSIGLSQLADFENTMQAQLAAVAQSVQAIQSAAPAANSGGYTPPTTTTTGGTTQPTPQTTPTPPAPAPTPAYTGPSLTNLGGEIYSGGGWQEPNTNTPISTPGGTYQQASGPVAQANINNLFWQPQPGVFQHWYPGENIGSTTANPTALFTLG